MILIKILLYIFTFFMITVIIDRICTCYEKLKLIKSFEKLQIHKDVIIFPDDEDLE